MKKVIFSAAAFGLVAVSSMALAPTTAEAIPAFARQTGAACLSCHFQSFPTLTSFGRSFKMNAFTDVGDQALIEDDDLSIPAALNATVVIRPQFSSTNVGGAGAATTTAGNTATANITSDQVVLFGGRIGTNSGAFIELASGTFGNIQVLNSWDLGGFKAGFSVYKTGFGDTAGLQLTNAVGQHAGMLGGRGLGAIFQITPKNVGLGNGIGGVSVWGGNDLVVAQLGGITVAGAASGGVGNGWKLAPMGRVLVTPQIGDWSVFLGGTLISGKTGNTQTLTAVAATVLGTAPVSAATATALEMKKWGVDLGVEGAVGDTSIGVYADFASAAASKGTTANVYTGDLGQVNGYHFRANVKPLHNLIFTAGAGTISNDGGIFGGATAAVKGKSKQWQIGAELEVYQNFVVALTYNVTTANTAGTAAAAAASQTKTKTTLLDIEWLM